MDNLLIKVFWLALCYFLGSIPSGYLISRYFGKDILKIGWRKTSGSNVFKNVGKWQGIVTAFMDIGKGYLAVFLAQKLGFSSEIQIFSGLLAITGNNWSLFLNFAGGRGLGVFAGALFAFSPEILGFVLIPIAIILVIWDASIGSIFSLATAIFLSISHGMFDTIGVFTILSLIPIFIKRLSPFKELSFRNWKMTINRFIFDNDQKRDFRIKRIIEKFSSRD
ncbi:MAG: glycerol-3-phosphate acyltransferase [Candidatus Nealsonbacteria bacterium]|nr:glycerol-3-phosphate acyltransferase [Candidatus Nealsonbacteria bacterium]